MSPKPNTLIVDDGELTLARTLLEELGVSFWHLRAAAVHGRIPSAERLLMIPAGLAISLNVARARPKRGEPPTWMAFVEAELKSQRAHLRRAGFDYTVPENVHPAALRLLMSKAVFDGENTQRVTRVPYGGVVSYVMKLRRHEAILVDISPRGCRLFTQKPIPNGTRLTIQIPCGHETPLQLSGLVVRTAPAHIEGGEPGDTAVGIRFASIAGPKRVQFRGLLMERLAGPLSRPLGAEPRLLDDQRGPAPWQRRVDAFYSGTSCVLVGRELSENGMLVEKHAGLEIGKRMRLALPVDNRSEPLIIEAHVAQDKGDRLVLIFDWLDPGDQERLKQLTASLPSIHGLEDDTRTHTVVPAAAMTPGRRRR